MHVWSLSDPAANFAAVSPADSGYFVTSNPKASLTRALYVGGAGDVVAVRESGDAVTFAAVPAGTILPIRCVQVKNTGTDATDIVRLW